MLDFLTIAHLADEKAGNLSGGQKKLLELGRTMMVDAKIVFLDEVGAGVNRTLLNTIGDAIVRLNQERGYTFCVIEHDMDFIARLCDPVIVMAEGRVLAQGPAEHIMENEAVIEAYLGHGLKNKAGAAREGGAACLLWLSSGGKGRAITVAVARVASAGASGRSIFGKMTCRALE